MENFWEELVDIIEKSNKSIELLNGDKNLGIQECKRMHIPQNTALFIVVSNSKGIIIDNWIRILGQSYTDNFSIIHFNDCSYIEKYIEGLFIVANDVVGGLFAININRFSSGKNKVWYFAPDTLEWENLDFSYNEFLAWALQGNTDDFYSCMRWKNWKNDLKKIKYFEVVLIYPFLWAKECNIETANKNIVAFDEVMQINFDNSEKLG